VEREDIAAWEAAGLYDPAAPGAADRLALLEYLRERGGSVDAMVAAQSAGSLPGLAGDLARQKGRRRINARELAERAGVDLESVFRVSRAAGLVQVDPGDPIYLESDVETFKVFAVGAQFFGEDSALQFGRVIGAAMATVADAAMSEFGRDVRPRLNEAGASELEYAKAAEFASSLLVNDVPLAVQTLFFHHVEAAVRRLQVSGFAATAHLAVGFLDLVGSTAMGERLDANELGAALGDFERDAVEAVGDQGGRVVKTIGDEVMFVANTAQAACDIALAVTERVERHPVLPKLRGGLSTGGLVRGYGDYYGPVVNAAARIVKLADPGDVLVTDAVRREIEADGGAARFVAAGTHELRGVEGTLDLFRLERA
jgi:adenylate cyclase